MGQLIKFSGNKDVIKLDFSFAGKFKHLFGHRWTVWQDEASMFHQYRTCTVCNKREVRAIEYCLAGHTWSQWSDAGITNIMDSYIGGDIPIRRELRQIRECSLCKRKEVRKVDY